MAVGLFILGGSVYASKGEPGSEHDPIVSKSYVDAQLSGYQDKIDELTVQVLSLMEQVENNKEVGGNVEQVVDKTTTNYQLVTIPKGDTLVGEQGTEVIVRSGNGQIVAGDGGGLQDLTEGVDILSGEAAEKYHLLLIPRADGRGILANSELIVMVRGGYTIQ